MIENAPIEVVNGEPAQTIWADIFKVDAEIHKDGATLVLSLELLAAVLDNHNRLKAEGNEVPMLMEHERNGRQFGLVHELRIAEGYMQARFSFFRAQERDDFNLGLIRDLSPGLHLEFLHPHTGELLGPTLLELTFTSIAFQQNLRPPQETSPGMRLRAENIKLLTGGKPMAEQTAALAEEEEEEAPAAEEEEEMSAELTAAHALIASLSEQVKTATAQLSKLQAALSTEQVAASQAAAEATTLSQRVETLEDDKVRLVLAGAGVVGETDKLVKLARTDMDLFNYTLTQLRGGQQVEMGATGSVELSAGAPTDADILAEARDKAGATPGALGLYLAQNHPERCEALLKLAQNGGNYVC